MGRDRFHRTRDRLNGWGSSQQLPDDLREMVQMILKRWIKGIQPMRCADEIFERRGGSDILDAERDYRQAAINGALHFAVDLGRPIGVRGKNQDHHARALDGIDDCGTPVFSGRDITWRYPATDAFSFQLCTNGISSGFVLRRITDKNVVGH